jgi:hypothetical protein
MTTVPGNIQRAQSDAPYLDGYGRARHSVGAATKATLLIAVAFAGCARFEPRPIAPAETAARFEQRTLDNLALKSFLETNLHRELTDWPARMWNFEMLALAAFYYQPGLEVARALARASSRNQNRRRTTESHPYRRPGQSSSEPMNSL